MKVAKGKQQTISIYECTLLNTITHTRMITFFVEPLSNSFEYSKSSVMRCRNDSGSLKLTGIGILLSSLPIQLRIIDHSDRPCCGLAGMDERRVLPANNLKRFIVLFLLIYY
jgi:hypothetical protein